jgi:hypothetical protein
MDRIAAALAIVQKALRAFVEFAVNPWTNTLSYSLPLTIGMLYDNPGRTVSVVEGAGRSACCARIRHRIDMGRVSASACISLAHHRLKGL